MSPAVDLQSRFDDLLSEFILLLSERRQEPKEMIERLLRIPPDEIGEHFTVLFKSITSSDISLDDFTSQLKKYMQFFNYKLFKEMAVMLASYSDSNLLAKVKEYEKDAVSFCKATSVSILAKFIKCGKDETIFTPMHVCYEKDPDHCTLMDLDDLRQKLGKQLGSGLAHAYSASAMFLFKVEIATGCQYITWLVPNEVAPHLMTAKDELSNRKFFEEQKVCGITFDVFRPRTSGSSNLPTNSSSNNQTPSKYLCVTHEKNDQYLPQYNVIGEY